MRSNLILLVEDNPDEADLAIRAFQTGPQRPIVVLAGDGVEALDYLLGMGTHAANPPALPDVVLLDLKLPRINGLEVLRRLRSDERTKDLPVVILTSSLCGEDLERGYALGANSYVRKPVQFTQFVETAKTLGTYWLTINERVPRS
jgi:two-component system response regulator